MKTLRALSATILALAALASLSITGCEGSTAAPAAATPAPVPLTLGDCTVVGASVSAGCEATLQGFRTASLLEPTGHCTLASVLGAITESTPPSGGGNTMFFMDPVSIASQQIAAAHAANPRVLFAIDFLFWHGYGDRLDSAGRLARLEDGLKTLDTFTCPIVIGDIPDMSHTALISKSQTPDGPTMAKLNERIAAWASQRPRVVVIPLRETVAKAIKSEPISFGGRSFDGPAARQLFTVNGLHVTPQGLIALCHECLLQLRQKNLLAANLTWDTDPDRIMQRLIDAKKAKQEQSRATAK